MFDRANFVHYHPCKEFKRAYLTPSRTIIPAVVLSGFAALALLLTMLLSNGVLAQSTTLADEYAVQPGKVFQLIIDSSKSATATRYQLLNAPAGASLRTNSAGDTYIHWIPASNVAAQTVVLVRAVDSVAGISVGSKRIVLRRVSDLANAESGQVTSANAVSHANQPASRLLIPKISTQQLVVGERYQLFIAAREIVTNTGHGTGKSTDVGAIPQRIIMAANGLPAGATFARAFRNTYMLQWIPLQTQGGEHVVLFSAMHESASGSTNAGGSVGERKNAGATHRVVLQVSAATGNTEATAKEKAASTKTASRSSSLEAGKNNNPTNTIEIPASRNDQLSGRPYYLTESSRLDPLQGGSNGAMATAPELGDKGDEVSKTADFAGDETPPGDLALKPVSSQIVSAGSYLQFRVQPQSAGGNEVTLQVDRLPQDATFDQNEDGSRTFYWQTNTQQQGEHLFRFTATTADEPGKQASMDVMIIVGDPTIATTRPR